MSEERFLKYRNPYGQIVVVYKKVGNSFLAGVSFCNPKDFNLPRNIRQLRGVGVARGRMANAPIVIPGIDLDTDDKDAQHRFFRKYALEYIMDHASDAGVRKYRGRKPGEFETWFKLFCEKEISASC